MSNPIRVFSGSSNKPLAEKIASKLGIPLSNSELSTFSDGETKVRIRESVRGCDVFIVQSIVSSDTKLPNGTTIKNSPNDNLMEMLLLADGCKGSFAKRVIGVVPYMGYARQDRKAHPRDPISAKVVAQMLSSGGYDGVITFDLHAPQIQGFFSVPVDALPGHVLLEKHYKEKFPNRNNIVGAAADIGDVKRTDEFCKKLNIPMVVINKNRPEANVSEVAGVYGDVKGKTVIMIDDMVDTAGTICNAAKALIEEGAVEVYVCATHGILSGPAIERIKKAPIKELTLLDTVDIPPEKILDNIHITSASQMLALAVKQLHQDERNLQIISDNGEFNKDANASITRTSIRKPRDGRRLP